MPLTRKARFRAALALAGMTTKDWAEEYGVTPEHVYTVLAGRRLSRRLTDAIDVFIEKHLKRAAA